jgi:hypothetical protein
MSGRILARQPFDHGLRLVEHRLQLPDVIRLGGHLARQDNLLRRHHQLCVVALHPAPARLYDPAVRVGRVGHTLRIDAARRRLRLAPRARLPARLLRGGTGIDLRLLARRGSLSPPDARAAHLDTNLRRTA